MSVTTSATGSPGNLTTLAIAANHRSGQPRPVTEAVSRTDISGAELKGWSGGDVGPGWRTLQGLARGLLARAKRRIVAPGMTPHG